MTLKPPMRLWFWSYLTVKSSLLLYVGIEYHMHVV